jgi:membrane-associated phospholipid phosphatase
LVLKTKRDSLRDSSAGAADAAAEQLAKELARRDGPVRLLAARGLRELGALDRAVYSAVAATPTPSLDEPLRRLSNAANNSGLWLATAAGLSVVGGRAGRRAAVRGTVAIGVTSALVNLAVKSAWSRQRPDRAGIGVPLWRNVRMPASTSFPSGHAASGFAFAAAIGRDQPWLGVALRFLAATVAYSRVHTGVHYPGDIVVGSLIGEGTGQAVAGLMDRLSSRSEGPPTEVPPGGRRRAVRSKHGPARRAPAGAEGCRGGSPPGPTGPTDPSPPPGGRQQA